MIYFGRVGSLIALPSPQGPYESSRRRPSTVSATIGGGAAVSLAADGRRVLTPTWNALAYTTYQTLEAYFVRANGPGPWVWLDSFRRNHLSLNQASATSAFNDTSGFSVDGSESLASTAYTTSRGPRALRWDLPGTVTSGVLTFNAPSGLAGVPAPGGQPWTFSGQLTCPGIAASVTVTPTLVWLRLDGSVLSTTAGAGVAVTAAGWTAFSVVSAGPPAGAVAVLAQLSVPVGVLTTAAIAQGSATSPSAWPDRGSGRPTMAQGTQGTPRPARGVRVATTAAPLTTTTLIVDSPVLDLYNGVRAWAPGTGVPRVSWVSLSDVQSWRDRKAPVSAQLVEVG